MLAGKEEQGQKKDHKEHRDRAEAGREVAEEVGQPKLLLLAC